MRGEVPTGAPTGGSKLRSSTSHVEPATGATAGAAGRPGTGGAGRGCHNGRYLCDDWRRLGKNWRNTRCNQELLNLLNYHLTNELTSIVSRSGSILSS